MPATPILCGSETCIWVFQGGTWTVQSDNCNTANKCGCFDTTNFIPTSTAANGKRALAPDVFLDKAREMLQDTRLNGRKTRDGTKDLLDQTAPASNPSDNDKFETPCMS